MLSRTTEQHELNRLCLARFVVIWENLVLNLKKLQLAKPCIRKRLLIIWIPAVLIASWTSAGEVFW